MSWRYSVRKHRKEQRRIAEVLAEHWDTRAAKPGKRMRRCCDTFMAALNLKSAAIKQCPLHCDVMLCPVCLQHRHRTTLKKANYCVDETIRPATEDDAGDYLRHIVLTTPKVKGDVRAAAETLALWFTWMKRRTAWKTNVRASMGVFECTGNAKDGWGWHVHCLTIGEFWQNQCKVIGDDGKERPADPATECQCIHRKGKNGRRNAPEERCLAQEWYQVTGGIARIVHISAAGANHRSGKSSPIAEAIKYVVKTVDLDASALVDFQIGMKGFQRVRWSGVWYGMQPPDDGEYEPRVMVAPDELWLFSTGVIGELFARMCNGDPLVIEAATAAGWTMIPFVGPLLEGRARPPPEVKLPKEFAVTAVELLEEGSDALETKTDKYFTEHPNRALPFKMSHLPY